MYIAKYFACAPLLASSIAAADTFSGRVIGIADGDTLALLDSTNQQHKIRLCRIDAHHGSRKVEWPDKESREQFEIEQFVEAYARLPGAPHLKIIGRGEKPDFIVAEVASGQEFGVELTSVYIDDRSVPDVHMVDGEPAHEPVPIPFDKAELERYQECLLSAIEAKIRKARAGYVTARPLILAIYVNEYIGIYLGEDELDDLVRRNEALFDGMAPLAEVVFWNLGNGGVFRVKPS